MPIDSAGCGSLFENGSVLYSCAEEPQLKDPVAAPLKPGQFRTYERGFQIEGPITPMNECTVYHDGDIYAAETFQSNGRWFMGVYLLQKGNFSKPNPSQ
jgi:hypothetical protein